MAAGSGVDFVSADQIHAAAQEAGLDEPTTEALVEDYESAQLQALKTGLLAAAFLALLSLAFTRDLPHEAPKTVQEQAGGVFGDGPDRLAEPAQEDEGRPMIQISRGQAWRIGLLVALRTTASVTALVAAYFLIPTRSADDGADLPWLLLELCVFAVIVGIQVPAIVKAKYPVLRAVETMAVLVPLYLLLFARIYLTNSLNDQSAFTEPLNLVTALYFTVTVFASVGFGDIYPETDSMRMLVTAQMLLNLIVFGVVIRLLASAARRGVARRGGQTAVADLGPPGN